jgi:hypothetical protein
MKKPLILYRAGLKAYALNPATSLVTINICKLALQIQCYSPPLSASARAASTSEAETPCSL